MFNLFSNLITPGKALFELFISVWRRRAQGHFANGSWEAVKSISTMHLHLAVKQMEPGLYPAGSDTLSPNRQNGCSKTASSHKDM